MFNLMEKKVIRDLDPDDIDRLVSVSGMVTRCSNIIPEVRLVSNSLTLDSARHCQGYSAFTAGFGGWDILVL